METSAFETATGTALTAVTADEMGSVDRVATESVGLALLSMMENAGRNLSTVVEEHRNGRAAVVFAGAGGSGGGGLACARHLSNRGVPTTVVLARAPEELAGATETQYRVLEAMDAPIVEDPPQGSAAIAVDALVGYGPSEGLQGRTAELAEACTKADAVVSLDVPSGVNATDGTVPGPAVDADTTLTLALPKTGLGPNAGDLLLGDIAIPKVVFDELGIPYRDPFGTDYVVPIRRNGAS